MSTTPVPPIAVAGPGVYPIPYPPGTGQPAGGQWQAVKVENATPYTLTLFYDGNPVHSIPGYVADLFPLTLGPPGPLAPPSSSVGAPAPLLSVATVTPAPSGYTGSGTIRASFARHGDIIPGAYPLALQAAASTAGSEYPSEAASAVWNGSTVTFIPAPPAGSVYSVGPMITFTQPPSNATAQLAGLTSGVPYFQVGLSSSAINPASPFGIQALDEGLAFSMIGWTGTTGPVRASTVYTPVDLSD